MKNKENRFYPSHLNHLGREFIFAAMAHLIRGRFRITKGYRPVTDHRVPGDFVGIATATNEDPKCDAYLITALNELGITRVRVDRCNDENTEFITERLLEKLSAGSFSILLHLVQSPAEARRMPEAKAKEQWRQFVDRTLQLWGRQLELVEVGSTINRKKWAGYSLNGWLSAWTAAFHEVRRHNLPLLGPNITDFEPYFNEGTLAILKKRGLLPDIHTVNLFAERAIEPEAWDPKLLGARAAPLLKANLVHKASVLSRVGQHYGLEKTFSTSAFWTLPRINRILHEVEEKQADYVSRYLILAAAAGRLARVYWGPLISRREGLIDDATDFYPELEQVTFYGRTFGQVENYRKRPAFYALKQFQQTIPGTWYRGPVHTGSGLELHQFQSPENTLIDLAWTTNGRCAILADLYQPEDLKTAEYHDRDGTPLPRPPDLITESPLYLEWKNGARSARSKEGRPSAGLVIDAHRRDGQYYIYRDQQWRGMVFAADREEAEKLFTELHPRNIPKLPVQESLRQTRNAIWKISDPRRPEASLAIKQPARLRLNKQIQDRFKPSKARRSWNGACELLRRGISTPLPVAWFERHDRSNLRKNWYVCEFMDSNLSVRHFFSAFAQGQKSWQKIEADKFYRSLSRFLLDMHQRGVHFRDLSGGNIMVRINQDLTLSFSLIDTARARFHNRAIPLRKRLSDLKRACHKLHWPGRIRFMKLYLNGLGKKFALRSRLPFYLYDLKARLKKKLRK